MEEEAEFDVLQLKDAPKAADTMGKLRVCKLKLVSIGIYFPLLVHVSLWASYK
jgi:hypothetical protein